jgi:hypothetical protein
MAMRKGGHEGAISPDNVTTNRRSTMPRKGKGFDVLTVCALEEAREVMEQINGDPLELLIALEEAAGNAIHGGE